ncbi:hypothetical protein E4J66_04115 [Actinomyces viscosus]|uniref:Lipoprotein n=1 Tax=Actinomyces viscosus TaxID=1656 RepID=A0A448PNX1_ACTVI|nr:hypothetical protein [Actinomyces viscosus]TFH53299.1 hypothetical protein E4J66_04115 [Actinomyces viscosus]VEI18069.1 Uncharacterised protein [Actinomyces viscosus]
MRTTRTAATLLAGLALATTPVLTACSQSATSSGSDSSSSSSSSAASDSSANSTESDKDSSATASSTTSSNLPKETPSGYQEVTAPTVGVSFAVPDSWQSLGDLDPAQKQAAAQTMGIDVNTLEQQMASLDIFYRATEPDENGFSNNSNVAKTLVPMQQAPTESDMETIISRTPGATKTSYSTKETANGEAAVASYTITMSGKQANGAYILAPTKTEGQYAVITVSAGSAEKVEELATVITDTLH